MKYTKTKIVPYVKPEEPYPTISTESQAIESAKKELRCTAVPPIPYNVIHASAKLVDVRAVNPGTEFQWCVDLTIEAERPVIV